MLNTMSIKKIVKLLLISVFALMFASCNKNTSNSTGWKYNDAEYGGFQVVDNYEQDTPPGMVLIQGGTFTMGRVNEDTYTEWNNYPRRVTVNTFYMDQYEISNRDWKEYVYWMDLMYGGEVAKKCRPDSTVWREELAYNEPYLNYYFSHVAYDMYPVVGVTWEQATDYCAWRTDRVNERILYEEGVIDFPDFAAIYRDSTKVGNDSIAKERVFNVNKYEKVNSYQPDKEKSSIKNEFGDVRKTTMSDGLMLPNFRLPTEAEWEFAARGGNKSSHTQYSGSSNIDRVAWFESNSGRQTHPVKSKKANELGIYDMSGNVSEWCEDWKGGYNSESQNNPAGLSNGIRRVCRGGSWDVNASNCRVSARNCRMPIRSFNYTGLRLVLSE